MFRSLFEFRFNVVAVAANQLSNDEVRRSGRVDSLEAGEVSVVEFDEVAFELIGH
jgi:hypothetical protein